METYHGISIEPHQIRIFLASKKLYEILFEQHLEIISTIRLSTSSDGKTTY